MAFNPADRVLQTSTTSGLGTLDLIAPPPGMIGFVAGCGDGFQCPVLIVDSAGNWELTKGTVMAGTGGGPDQLARAATPYKSSNAGAKVDFDTSAKTVACIWVAELIPQFTDIPAYADDQIMQRKSGGWVVRTMAQLLTDLVATGALPKSGGTMTGALVGEDGATWDDHGIKNLKNLGINCAPGYTLDVSGSDGALRLSGTGTQVIQRFVNSDGEVGYIGDANTLVGSGGSAFGVRSVSHFYQISDTGYIIFGQYTGGAFSEKMRLSASGGLSIGTTDDAGAASLLTQGDIGARGAIKANGDITAFNSDIRLKTGIKPIRNALKKVLGLSGFTYKLNDKAKQIGIKGNRRYVGVSAQDVKKVLPWAVRPAPADKRYMTVQYEKLVPLLIEAIKEQQEQIEELKRMVNAK